MNELNNLNQIRIKCDHDNKQEPQKNEVFDLIEQTDKFIHYID
jgi:ribosomal protein S24E